MAGVDIAVRPYGAPQTSTDTFDTLPEWKPGTPTDTGNYSQLPAWTPSEDKPLGPPVGAGEAAAQGALNAVSFGMTPALSGLAEAAGPEWTQKDIYGEGGNPIAPIVGAAKLLHSHFAGHPDDAVRKDYEAGRKKALESEEAARKQHPWAYVGGQLGGMLALPVPGLAEAGLGGRLAQGAAVGAGAGALSGAGTAISEGQDPSGIAGRALTGGAVGGVMGGALGGAFGPRVVNPNTSGQRAAQTAIDLGAPLPKGITSDIPAVRTTTAKLQQVPVVGGQITTRLGKTQAAAGERVGDIASGMAPTASRAAADAIVRPGLQAVIDKNKAAIDASYNGVRGLIDQTQPYTMPRTDKALDEIMAARKEAGWTNPAQGLEQFRNVAGGATFNGAHRARVDAREAGNALVPHPGYNSADFNKLTTAMKADIRNMAFTSGGAKALKAFDDAETQFGKLADQNDALHKLLKSSGQGALETLLGAANNKGGNVPLLAQLRNSMDPADFQQVGGVLLHELGTQPATGEFSIAKFVTGWNKISPEAKSILFSPSHLKNIEEIVGMGQHIKGSIREQTSSHSAGFLVLLDVAKDAVLLAGDIASGGLGAGTALGAATTGGIGVLTHWLAQPAKAASMGAFTRAYRTVTLGQPTPARLAVFNIATRNLANNLGVPAENILKRVSAVAGGSNNEQPSTPRP